MMLCQIFHGQRLIFNPWEAIKVGICEISFPLSFLLISLQRLATCVLVCFSYIYIFESGVQTKLGKFCFVDVTQKYIDSHFEKSKLNIEHKLNSELILWGNFIFSKQKFKHNQKLQVHRSIKGTKKLNELLVENCKCLKHDVQPLDTSIIIDIQQS